MAVLGCTPAADGNPVAQAAERLLETTAHVEGEHTAVRSGGDVIMGYELTSAGDADFRNNAMTMVITVLEAERFAVRSPTTLRTVGGNAYIQEDPDDPRWVVADLGAVDNDYYATYATYDIVAAVSLLRSARILDDRGSATEAGETLMRYRVAVDVPAVHEAEPSSLTQYLTAMEVDEVRAAVWVAQDGVLRRHAWHLQWGTKLIDQERLAQTFEYSAVGAPVSIETPSPVATEP